MGAKTAPIQLDSANLVEFSEYPNPKHERREFVATCFLAYAL